ncbi:ATP synthase subunit C lysine N-methyltransferase-like isoform X2 [Mobula hypostoma]|uniref:ATP synthase subunit C lysine N-methyltransferase-like isoform X2 n=1 Tax=Mobula hypostoma TaxID=723540 RepID=UPI002FC30A1E
MLYAVADRTVFPIAPSWYKCSVAASHCLALLNVGGGHGLRTGLRGREEHQTELGVIAAAKQGFRAVGYELNPWLVWYSRYRAWQQGLHRHTRFYISDFWKVNFSEYSNVVIFGVPQMMESLEKKLQKELKNDARVVACRFPFPSWIAEHESGKGIDAAWLYNAKSFKTTAKEGNQH